MVNLLSLLVMCLYCIVIIGWGVHIQPNNRLINSIMYLKLMNIYNFMAAMQHQKRVKVYTMKNKWKN